MKKYAYPALILLASSNVIHAQGLLDRMKSKVTKAIENKIPTSSTDAGKTSDGKAYTHPSKFGTVIMTFSAKEISDHQGTYNVWFPFVSVINNQLDAKVIDYDHELGRYSGGAFQKSSAPINMALQGKDANGSEIEMKSKDFSQIDMVNAMLKKGPSVAGPRVPGKIGQTYTFKGKALGDFMTAYVAHNPDSTAIVVVGMGFAKGAAQYSLSTSNGQKVDLPVKIPGLPLISPDGKVAAAVVQLMTGTGTDVYLSNGGKITTGLYDPNYGFWLHNNGTLYYVNNSKNMELFKNGQLFITTNFPIDTKKLFINSNETTACWMGERGLYFSDGSIFENGESPHKVVINGKEVIVFLDIDLATGNLYLCQHEL